MKAAMWKVDGHDGLRFRDPRLPNTPSPNQPGLFDDELSGVNTLELDQLIQQRLSKGPTTVADLGEWLLTETSRWRDTQAAGAVRRLRDDLVVDTRPPPLLVRAHPGPTSQTQPRLDLDVQFFTSRGFVVADIDYRGSTGYGRAYRQALSGLWGIADAEDCITVARWLTESERSDPSRIVISGASAGGFTALRALILSDVFVAASCVSGIVDLLEYRRRTHKFQQHELDRLVGPLPESLPHYKSRSLTNLVDQIDRPVFLAHGFDDRVVPPAAIQGLLEAMRCRGTPPVVRFFEHEGHPPTRPKNRAALLRAEYDLYQAVFAVEPEPNSPHVASPQQLATLQP